MDIINDFLILIWGDKPQEIWQDEIKQKNKLIKNLPINEKFYESCAIVLCANVKNYERLFELKSFCEIASYLHISSCHNVLHVKILQIAILDVLMDIGKKHAQKVLEIIEKLSQNNIINDEYKNKIQSILDLVEDKKQENEIYIKDDKIDVKTLDFKEHLAFLNEKIQLFKQFHSDDLLSQKSQNLLQKINNNAFSIGITGVMNAGKSTMLNALLGKEVLGTSVVPETANLTIIKYSKTPHARVNFWTKSEWDRIENSASHLPSIKEFIDLTKNAFKDNLDTFITQNGHFVNISPDELVSYTSAKHSNLKCNLVKSVELFSDLDFVKDGVQIVDTPGLDDPVVQREEITKDYLHDCDVMIHLMNVNQSATEKDVDFIIDSLTYQHIARLLIVITRIDTVSENELNEVVEYTKKSIHARLEENNQEAKFNNIISKIDFLPIAGKLALMHRTNQEKEALSLGYSLEKTGILQIEKYLQDVLFGSTSEKNTLLLQSCYKEFNFMVEYLLSTYAENMQNLGKSVNELKEQLSKTVEENKHNFEQINQIHMQIDQAKYSLSEYFKTLQKFVQNKFLSLKNIIIQRINDDVSYEWRKNKQKPTQNRIKSMIQTAMKDGIIDIVRDYRYEFSKRMQSEMEQISQISSVLNTHQDANSYDAKEYFEQNFSGSFLSGSYEVTNQRVLKELAKVKKDDIENFAVNLDKIFTDTINDLSLILLPTLQNINENLLQGFITLASKPTNELKQVMQQKENILKQHIKLMQEDEVKVQQSLHVMSKNIISLNELKAQIQGVMV